MLTLKRRGIHVGVARFVDSMTARRNVLVQLALGLGAAFAGMVVPIPIVIALYLGNAHLVFGGYLILGAAIFWLIVVPGIAASILAGWLVDRRTPEGRRPFLTLICIVGVLQIGGIVAIVVATVLARASPIIPVSIGIPAMLYTIGLVWLGERLGRRDAARDAAQLVPMPPDQPLTPVEPVSLRKTAWIMGAVFAGVAVVGEALVLIAAANIHVTGQGHQSNFILPFSLFVLAFAFLAVDTVAIAKLLPLSTRIKPLFRGSYLTQKEVSGVVLRGRKDELDLAGKAIAHRYAVIMRAVLPLNAASFLTLYLALALVQLSSFVTPGKVYFAGLRIGFLAVMVVTAVLGTALLGRNLRRVRQYLLAAPTHVEPLP